VIATARDGIDLDELLGRLRCPACGRAPLRDHADRVSCPACGSSLRALSRTPPLLVSDGAAHLDQFVPRLITGNRLRDRVERWASSNDGRFALGIPVLPDSQLPAIRTAFAAMPPGRRRVLDVGGGKGRWRELLGWPPDYTVADVLDPSALAMIAGVAYVQAPAHALPFADRSFDVVLSIQVLEHVPDPGRVLAETARALAPGGLLILTTAQAWRTHGAPHDYFRYTRYGLESLLRGAGLEPAELRPLGGPASVVAITIDNNVPALSRPVVRQLVAHPLWRLAALLDRTVFREALAGPNPETSGWLVLARRP
jgi:SAM-dependent methyltransferase